MTDLPFDVPRVPLAHLPTPLEPLPRLSAELGREVWVKRDDLTGLGLGGNKVRKLEYLLGAAVAEGHDTVVTFGALQSNHARQTAAAAARLGLRCELILTKAVNRRDDLYEHNGNRLLDDLFGAVVHECPNDDGVIATTMERVAAGLAERGARAVWIGPGGSDAIGTLGYVHAAFEAAEQCRELGLHPGSVVVAVSTGGTYAGLLLGAHLAGWDVPILGVDVYKPADRTRPAVEGLLAATAAALEVGTPESSRILLSDEALGPGYGVPTDDMVEALGRVARAEGLVLDPVYSGKAAALLLRHHATGELPDGPVLFWHTGGSPGVFAYGEDCLG